MLFYTIVRIVLMVLMLVSSVFIVVNVVKQKSDVEGISAIQSGSSSDTFYGKNKARNKEASLKKWTYIASVTLAVSAILFFIFTNLATK